MGNTNKINKIIKSYKKEGYVFVGVSGKAESKIRKVYTYKSQPGLGYINLDTDIYKFNWDGQAGTEIEYVGNYKSVDEALLSSKVKAPSVVTKVVEAPVVAVQEDGSIKHEKYETIKTCIENNIPVYLVGPAGSGKNHTLEQIAKELGLEFHFTNSVQQEFKLTGFIDAGGKYHETEFYKAFTGGGLFFLDEMDASVPEVLVLLNAAIANRYFEFPNGKVSAHEDFRVVAAGNTVGSGADENYTGRLVLDQATLDRFAIIEFGYSLKIEAHLAKGNMDLVTFIRELRAQAHDKGIRATFSYRCISMVTKLEGKLELTEIMVIAILKGLDKDTIKTLRPEGHSQYHMALRKVQA
jgi:hypothetical protein